MPWTEIPAPEKVFELIEPSGQKWQLKITAPTGAQPNAILTLFKFIDGSFQSQGTIPAPSVAFFDALLEEVGALL